MTQLPKHEQHSARQRDFAKIADAIDRAIGRDLVYWPAADRARRTTAEADEDAFWLLLLSPDLATAIDAGDTSPEIVERLDLQSRALEAVKVAMRELNAQERQRHAQLRAQLIAAGGDPDRPQAANDSDGGGHNGRS